MRFRKGEIELILDRDRPLLRLVWEAEIATSSQLFQFRRLANPEIEKSMAAFGNRLERLKKHNLLAAERIYAPALTMGYRITSEGISRLTAWGLLPKNCLAGGARTSVPECIYLNTLRIKFWNEQSEDRWISRQQLNAGKLRHQQPEDDGLSARISLTGRWGVVQIGIVYKVPTRSPSEYRVLRKTWAAARPVNWIVCIVPSEGQALWLASQLAPCGIQVFFTARDEFQDKTVGCRAYALGSVQPLPLKELVLHNLQARLLFGQAFCLR